MQWDGLNREYHRVLGNGGTISHTWDQAGRETLIENRDRFGIGQFIATNTYSQVGNRLSVLEMDGTLATYAYDPSSQVTSESRGGTMAYSRSDWLADRLDELRCARLSCAAFNVRKAGSAWDPNGNRTQQWDSGALTTGTFNAANQQTLITPPSGPPTTQSFDAVGNLTLENTGGAFVTSTWTPDNRMSSYVDNLGNSVQSIYSDDGLRKQRTKNGVTTNLTYDGTVLLLETDTSGNPVARYTNSPDAPGGIISQNRSGATSFFGLDSQTSVRIMVSTGGVVTDSRSWTAFGEPIQTGTTETPYGYAAGAAYYVDLADLFNAWNRWMKPSMKQWRSVDPIGFNGGSWNPYQYVGNEPVMRFDPSGLDHAGSGYSGVDSHKGYLGSADGCPQMVQDHLGYVCSDIRKMSRLAGNHHLLKKVNNCINASGMVCPSVSPKMLRCLVHGCNGGIAFSCNDPASCNDGDVCGYTHPDGCPIWVVICTDQGQSQATCGDYTGDISIDWRYKVIMHEMLHACDVQHVYPPLLSDKPPHGDWECNNVIACCMKNVLRGNVNASRTCKRHVDA